MAKPIVTDELWNVIEPAVATLAAQTQGRTTMGLVRPPSEPVTVTNSDGIYQHQFQHTRMAMPPTLTADTGSSDSIERAFMMLTARECSIKCFAWCGNSPTGANDCDAGEGTGT